MMSIRAYHIQGSAHSVPSGLEGLISFALAVTDERAGFTHSCVWEWLNLKTPFFFFCPSSTKAGCAWARAFTAHCCLCPSFTCCPLGMVCKVTSKPNPSVIPSALMIPLLLWFPLQSQFPPGFPVLPGAMHSSHDQVWPAPAWQGSPRAGDVVSRRAELSWLQSSSSSSPRSPERSNSVEPISWRTLSSSSGFQVIPGDLPVSLPQRSAAPEHKSSRKTTSSPHLGANKVHDEIPEKRLWKKLSCSLRRKNKGNPWI